MHEQEVTVFPGPALTDLRDRVRAGQAVTAEDVEAAVRELALASYRVGAAQAWAAATRWTQAGYPTERVRAVERDAQGAIVQTRERVVPVV